MAAPNPYVGPVAIAEGKPVYGRAKESQDIRDLLTTGRILLLYAPSGAGRTSLVKSVLRELREREGLRVMFVPDFRRGRDARNRYLASLCEALEEPLSAAQRAGRPEPAAVESLDVYLKGRPRVASEGPVKAEAEVLVLDRFEEVFTLDPRGREATLEFLRELAAALNDRSRLALLCMRESDVPKLDDYLHLFPTGLSNRYRLGLLNYDSAREAIIKPAADVHVAYEPGAAEALLQRLWDLRGDTEAGGDAASHKGGWLEPVLLQAVCSNLWESCKPTASISAADVARVDVGSALAGFYAQAARYAATEATIPERDVRDWVEEQLITPGGSRGEARWEREAGWGLAARAVEALDERHLMRLEAHAGRQWYELANDVLIHPIQADNARWRGKHLAPFELSARSWARAKRPDRALLSSREWLRARRWTRAHWRTLRGVEKEFWRKSTWRIVKWRAVPALALTLVLLAAFSVLGLILRSQALELRLAQQVVLLKLDRAKQLAMSGAIDHALPVAVGAAEKVGASVDNGQVDGLAFSARDTLLSVLRNAGDLRRMFAAEDEVFQAVALRPGSDRMVAYGGMAGKIYVAGLDRAFARTLDQACPLPKVAHNQVRSLAFDTQGRWLAAGCESGEVAVWSTADWTERGRWRAHPSVEALAWSRDGSLLASGGRENTVKLMRLRTDETPLLEELDAAPTGNVWSLASSPAADRLVIGDGDGAVWTCDFQSASLTHRCAKRVEGEKGDAILAIAFSSDGSRIALGHYSGGVGRIDLWDAELSPSSREAVDAGPLPGAVQSIRFVEICGRSYLAFGRGTGLWYRPADVRTAPVEGTAELRAEPPPVGSPDCAPRRRPWVTGELFALAFHEPSGLLAAATRGGYVAVMDPLHELDRTRAQVTVDTSKDAKLRAALVAVDRDNGQLLVPLRNIDRGADNLVVVTVPHAAPENVERLTTTAVGTGQLDRVSASASRRRLAALGADGSVAVVDLGQDISQKPSSVASLTASDFDGLRPVRIALSPNGALLVCAFGVRKDQPDSKQLLAAALDAEPPKRTWISTDLTLVREIAFSSDGTLFAAGGEAPERVAGFGVDRVQLWNVRDSRLERRHTAKTMDVTWLAKKVHDIAFAADAAGHPLVVSGGEYGQIDLWDARTGEALPTLRADSRPVLQIAFQPEASLLAAADDQGVVRLWSTAQWEPMQLTPRSDSPQKPGFLAFGPNGDWLAVGTDTLTVWDLNLASLRRKACAILRDPGQHGAEAADALPRVCREQH